MKLDLELPARLPVMTLPEVVFFPQVMMPLYIFEPRYRSMLRDCLEGHRMFAVAGINQPQKGITPDPEPAYKVGTAGVIRACRTQEDGTSQLILQGLSRVRLDRLFEDKPYREAAITGLESTQTTDRDELMATRSRLLRLINKYASTIPQMPVELLRFVEGIEEPEDFVDLVAYSIVQNPSTKQAVLETLVVEDRFKLLIEEFKGSQEDYESPY